VFKHAIVRTPGMNFAEGLTSVDLGVPVHEQVLAQHARYCDALVTCGLTITTLPEDSDHPDSTFVEDTAVLTGRGAVLTRLGARSREGEVPAMRAVLRDLFPVMMEIEAPGTVDGGDICEVEDRFFIGLSLRTNEEGARQLAGLLAHMGYTSSVVDVRGMSSILHLKSGVSYVGDNTLIVMEKMAGWEAFTGYDLIRVGEEESYAANCVRVNERVLVPDGYPRLTAELTDRGFRPLALEMSEFRKMDGGLSCLSLRF
jgi:dimethylargininase